MVSEFDAAVVKFAQYLAGSEEDLRADYDTILQQEASWNERWKRQVDMLRQENMQLNEVFLVLNKLHDN